MRYGMSYFEIAEYCMELEVKLEKALDNKGRKAAVSTLSTFYSGTVNGKAGKEQIQYFQPVDMSWLDSFTRP